MAVAYGYQAGSYHFLYDSGVFLCSELITDPTVQRHGVLLQYKSGQDRTGGLVTDITLPVFLGRPTAVMEIGQVLFNAFKLNYMVQRGVAAAPPNPDDPTTYPGNASEDGETALRGIIADMYNGYAVRYQDAVTELGDFAGKNFLGGLVVTPDCFGWLTNPAGWVSFTGSFYEIGGT